MHVCVCVCTRVQCIFFFFYIWPSNPDFDKFGDIERFEKHARMRHNSYEKERPSLFGFTLQISSFTFLFD